MYRLDQNKAAETFRKYTEAYNPADPKIKLKINHTYRVAGICAKITASINEERNLAWLSL